MKKEKRPVFSILLLLVMLSFLVFLIDSVVPEKTSKISNISIISRGKNNESSMIMRQGIEQAASEMNVNISFITMSEENSVDEQKELIERECKNNVDAIIISPVDYEKMAEPIENASKIVPIILIESKVKSEKVLSSVSCDNFKLGESLGEEIIRKGNTKSKIAIMKYNMECSSIKERYDGFMNIMKNTENTFIDWELTGSKETSYYYQAKQILTDNDINVVVAFDPGMSEIIATAKKDLIPYNSRIMDVQIYSSGSTSKIISFLEEEIINGTAMQNEFNVGYLGVKTAVRQINGQYIDSGAIASSIIDTENMYSKENQRILFPLIR